MAVCVLYTLPVCTQDALCPSADGHLCSVHSPWCAWCLHTWRCLVSICWWPSMFCTLSLMCLVFAHMKMHCVHLLMAVYVLYTLPDVLGVCTHEDVLCPSADGCLCSVHSPCLYARCLVSICWWLSMFCTLSLSAHKKMHCVHPVIGWIKVMDLSRCQCCEGVLGSDMVCG